MSDANAKKMAVENTKLSQSINHPLHASWSAVVTLREELGTHTQDGQTGTDTDR